LPPQPIPKSNASPELISHILIAKFLDGLPFYRQEKIWLRGNIDLPRATQANWSIQAGKLVQPLINLLLEKQREGPVMHIDETPVQVLKEPDKSPKNKKYFWVTVGGPPDKPIYRFHYNPSRGSDVAQALLASFQGTVMSDDWHVYARSCELLNLTHIACNDHARRKYKEALDGMPGRKSKKGKAVKSVNQSRSEIGLAYYQKLYAIEREIKTLSVEQKRIVRQEKSKPVWQAFKQIGRASWRESSQETTGR